MSGIKDIREQCKLPFLRFQMRFDMDGRHGTILGSDGVYLRVRFDGQRFASRVHPTWQMTFYDNDGCVIKDYKMKEEKHG